MWEGWTVPWSRAPGRSHLLRPSLLSDSQVPREIARPEMDRVKAQFVEAAIRGERAGFDMLELHCAHGYLLASFLSPLTNRRTDAWRLARERLRYPCFRPCGGLAGAQAHVGAHFGDRLGRGGITGDEAVEIAQTFARAGVDLVDVSTGQTVRELPIYGRMFQTPFSDQVRSEARVAMCGQHHDGGPGEHDLAAGRWTSWRWGAHLVDPFFMRAAAWYGATDIHCPASYLAGKDQIVRNSTSATARTRNCGRSEAKTRAELRMEARRSRWRRNDRARGLSVHQVVRATPAFRSVFLSGRKWPRP